MEALVLDGKRYVKASRAARLAGYTSDYVGQLCRSGKIKAKLVGRSWYVDEEELREYKSETKRTSRQKAREQVKESARHIAISEQHDPPHRSSNFERRARERQVSYDEDRAELIPEVKKVSVESELPAKGSAESGDTGEPAYEIENEGNQVVMSGEIDVADANDDVKDPDTVLLKPEIISKEEIDPQKAPKKAGSRKITRSEREGPEKHGEAHTEVSADTGSTKTDPTRSIELEVVSADDTAPSVPSWSRLYAPLGIIVASTVLCTGLVLLSSVWTYSLSSSGDGAYSSESRYTVDSIQKLADIYFK